ncbi:unnamed protein product [Mytilus coruscus]|uniref:Uncharacterized protein n=1 Tax=Mytilus coruscus TaxID=42192 RepID=A0A6J8EVP3_MYTCO|nr:unnamed protein product [Mytilus coruscus]
MIQLFLQQTVPYSAVLTLKNARSASFSVKPSHEKVKNEKKMPTETKAKQRLDYMTTIQLKERIINSKEIRTLKRNMDGLTEQIEKLTPLSGVILDAGVSKSFNEIKKNNNHISLSQFKENSPQHIFWKQQFEAATKSNLKQMRWHLTLLRWYIALHAKSPAAYRMITNSNVLCCRMRICLEITPILLAPALVGTLM